MKTINNFQNHINDVNELNGNFIAGGENGRVFMIKSEKLRKIAVKKEKKTTNLLIPIQ